MFHSNRVFQTLKETRRSNLNNEALNTWYLEHDAFDDQVDHDNKRSADTKDYWYQEDRYYEMNDDAEATLIVGVSSLNSRTLKKQMDVPVYSELQYL